MVQWAKASQGGWNVLFKIRRPWVNILVRSKWRWVVCLSWIWSTTRSTQRAQTSLAEADHYSHIAHCKNVEPWLWKTTHPPKKKTKKKTKKKKKVLDYYLHHDLGMLPLLQCFFAHLLILQNPDHHQNLISSSLYYSGPVHKISSQSVHNFLSNVVHRQTDKLTNATKNIIFFAKEVKSIKAILLLRPYHEY